MEVLKDEDKAGLKTTGLEDESEVKVEARSRGRPKNSKNKEKKSETADIMEMMMLTDRLQAKRERAKERQARKENKNMKLLFGMLGLAMNAFAVGIYNNSVWEALDILAIPSKGYFP